MEERRVSTNKRVLEGRIITFTLWFALGEHFRTEKWITYGICIRVVCKTVKPKPWMMSVPKFEIPPTNG